MNGKKLTFAVVPVLLGICRLKPGQPIPPWAQQGEFFSITKTSEEISIICPEKAIPAEDVLCERGWRALKITGILDFSLVGILSAISTALAQAGISIFAVSTYNTDYILIKARELEAALQTLGNDGHEVEFEREA